jgi:hypothetical protein
VDEAGHSGDTGSAESGSGAESRDRSLLNGWATSDSPWSNAGAALDPEEEVPSWRRPSTELRPFTRPPVPDRPSGEIRPPTAQNPAGFGDRSQPGFGERQPGFGDRSQPGLGDRAQPGLGDRAQPGFGDRSQSGEVRPFETSRSDNTGPAWSTGRARYSDLLAHLSPNGNEPTRTATPPSLQPGPVPPGPPTLQPGPVPVGPPPTDPTDPFGQRLAGGQPDAPRNNGFAVRPDTLQADDQRRTSELRAVDATPPSSAPPYPYEGDLDDARRNGGGPPPATQQRAAVPLSRPFPAVRPATPGGRRVDWIAPEPARHALEPNTAIDGLSRVEPLGPREEKRPSTEPTPARASYDPSSFPRRLPYEPVGPVGSAPPPEAASGFAPPTAYPGLPGRSAGDPGSGSAELTPRALPQRVPAEPDVPTVPEPPPVEPSAETPALARIATHLRRGDVPSAQDRQEGFDVKAILAAVREVDGVRDASLRSTPAGAHSLRLDLADGADPAEVSRQVARLLQDRMGLDAAMQGGGGQAPPAGVPIPSGFVPSQPVPAGRAPVSSIPGGTTTGDQARRLPQNPQAGRASVGSGLVTERPVVNGPNTPRVSTGNPAGLPVEAVPTAIGCGPPRPLAMGDRPGPRVVIENVQVNTFGTEATVEVRLAVGGRAAAGIATGPAVDGYLLRLCAMATVQAVNELLAASNHVDGPARCFLEQAAAVPFGPMQVAVVVLLLSCGQWVEQLAGSAVVAGDDGRAMVRATLAAVNRRLEALLS